MAKVAEQVRRRVPHSVSRQIVQMTPPVVGEVKRPHERPHELSDHPITLTAQQNGTFPGLGPVKRMSIKHHLELMNSII